MLVLSHLRVRASLHGTHRWEFPWRRACELVVWGLVSGLADLVEDVGSREPDVGAVGSRVGESLFGSSNMTQRREPVGWPIGGDEQVPRILRKM